MKKRLRLLMINSSSIFFKLQQLKELYARPYDVEVEVVNECASWYGIPLGVLDDYWVGDDGWFFFKVTHDKYYKLPFKNLKILTTEYGPLCNAHRRIAVTSLHEIGAEEFYERKELL